MARVTSTASGNIASFKSPGIVPIRSLKAHFLPVQEGTGDPSPTNVRPITGWTGLTAFHTGKNLIDESFLKNADNYPNAGAYGYFYTNDIHLIPNTQYRFVWYDCNNVPLTELNASNIHLYVSGANEYIVNNSSYRQYTSGFISPATGIVRFGIYHPSVLNRQDVLDAIFNNAKLLLQIGTSNESYEPYSGQTIPVTFPAVGKNLFNWNAPEINPNNTTASNATVRIITPNSYFIGASYSNYLMSNQIHSYSISNGIITINGHNVYGIGYAFRLTSGETYILSADNTGGRVDYAFYDSNGNYISGLNNKLGVSFTVPNNADITVIIFYSWPEDTDSTFTNIQLELGSTATLYEPFTNTVYGGYVDLVNGEVVAEWGITELFSTSSRWNSSYQSSGVHRYAISNGITGANDIVCEKFKSYKNEVAAQITNKLPDLSVCRRNNYDHIYFRDNNYTSTEEFAEAYAGTKLAIKLAEAIHYPINPKTFNSLKGVNNVWSTANDITEVEYDYAESVDILKQKKQIIWSSTPPPVPMQYKQIEYLESTGTQYIDTGLMLPDSGWGFTIDCTITNTSSVGSGAQATGALHYIYDRPRGGIRTGGGTATSAIPYTVGDRIVINAYYDNEEKRNVKIGENIYYGSSYDTTSAYFYILKLDDSHDLQSGRLYSVNIIQNGTKIMDLVPCVRKSDGKPGMYDTVSKTFFTNAGTGEFITPSIQNSIPYIYKRVEYLYRSAEENGPYCIVNASLSTGDIVETGSKCLVPATEEGFAGSPSIIEWYYNNNKSLNIWRPENAEAISVQYGNIDEMIIRIKKNVTLTYIGTYRVGSYKFDGNIYYFRIKDSNGNLKYNYVPVYRKSDGEPGFFETVNQVFYTNAGTGEFVIPT